MQPLSIVTVLDVKLKVDCSIDLKDVQDLRRADLNLGIGPHRLGSSSTPQ